VEFSANIGLEHDVWRTLDFSRNFGKFLGTGPFVVQPGVSSMFVYVCVRFIFTCAIIIVVTDVFNSVRALNVFIFSHKHSYFRSICLVFPF